MMNKNKLAVALAVMLGACNAQNAKNYTDEQIKKWNEDSKMVGNVHILFEDYLSNGGDDPSDLMTEAEKKVWDDLCDIYGGVNNDEGVNYDHNQWNHNEGVEGNYSQCQHNTINMSNDENITNWNTRQVGSWMLSHGVNDQKVIEVLYDNNIVGVDLISLSSWEDIHDSFGITKDLSQKLWLSLRALKSAAIYHKVPSDDNKKKDDDCSICLDKLGCHDNTAVRLSKCEHEFHEDCINNWLANSDTCPLCRTKVN